MHTSEREEAAAGAVLAAAVSDEPLNLDAAIAAVESDECGAVVSFSGVIRDHDGGRQVDRLSYSSHPTAGAVIAALADEVAASHPGIRLWVGHRVGDLRIGDPALVCAVASAHRKEAFDACATLVERVKAEVPIWKEQFFTDGTIEWVGIA
ncbi:molybdenum cofactor biosynthesis protein MoaE [Arthrobacter castelli]|uniref:molybdenum cofactor biosynthesis protein MoaE n=1 Tax=Arthrobacter castelli TaxID=271431 RepID=UPI000420F8BF|nr:molybdenum cofactor biosynthesis protein MoaE [Arthrobacter castelli]